MAQYKLHCFCQSGNSYKVALYLNCAGLDWEPVFTDFMHGATRDPKWREAVNEMGEAPVLEFDGKKLAQSGVILTYLAEKTGKFTAGQRGRAAGSAALDAVRQPQVHRLLRDLPLPEVVPADGAGPERAGASSRAASTARSASSRSTSAIRVHGRRQADHRRLLARSATCSIRRRRAATTGRRPIRTSPPGSGACARCRAGRTPTS